MEHYEKKNAKRWRQPYRKLKKGVEHEECEREEKIDITNCH